MLAIAIAVPGAICWMISPNLGKRRELERYVNRQTLSTWRTYHLRDFSYTLANGSTLEAITGLTANATKRGEATVVFYNEPQDMAVDALSFGLPAIIDSGGLGLFAGNPATTPKGRWYNELREMVLEETQEGILRGEFHDVPAKGNADIDQDAREDVNAIIRRLDPTRAKADADGLWLPVGDYAYVEYFEKARNIRQALPDINDCTSQIIRRKLGRPFPKIAGADFNGKPWNAGAVVQAFGDPKCPVYYVTGEFLKDGFEDAFLDEVYQEGNYDPEHLFWIGDSSGTWQDAHHSKGRASFDIFKSRRYWIEAPTEKKTDRGNCSRATRTFTTGSTWSIGCSRRAA
jgi:hypothetical protein